MVSALVLVATPSLFAQAAIASEAAPYRGLDQRSIASLNEADVADLLAGRGFGFALPAELNSYPGPTHLMELADALALSQSQRGAVRAIFEAMRADAVRLGKAFVAAETALDRAFAKGSIDAAALAHLTAEAARLEGALRAVHLRAHLDVHPLLTPSQIAAYDRLRGYAGAPGSHERNGSHDRPHDAH